MNFFVYMINAYENVIRIEFYLLHRLSKAQHATVEITLHYYIIHL